MKRWAIAGGALVSCYPLFFFVAAVTVHYPLAGPQTGHTGVRGAIHVHSQRSDGRGTREQIAAAAREAGLDFVIVTDHNVDALLPPAFIDGVLMIDAEEVSEQAGHVLAIGAHGPLAREGTLEDILHAGGRAIIAHPFQKKRPWTDWSAALEASGIELYSADSMFRTAWSRPVTRFLPALAGYAANPIHGIETIVEEQPEATQWLVAHPGIALCAHDAHGAPKYLSEFQALSFYVPVSKLNSDPTLARDEVLNGLDEGYCAFHGLAEGSGFAIGGLGPRRTARAGEVLRVQLPPQHPAEVRLVASGGARVDGWTLIATGPGAFLPEVQVRVPHMFVGSEWKPWLVPSPIRVEAR